jgi:hypothetical protein
VIVNGTVQVPVATFNVVSEPVGSVTVVISSGPEKSKIVEFCNKTTPLSTLMTESPRSGLKVGIVPSVLVVGGRVRSIWKFWSCRVPMVSPAAVKGANRGNTRRGMVLVGIHLEHAGAPPTFWQGVSWLARTRGSAVPPAQNENAPTEPGACRSKALPTAHTRQRRLAARPSTPTITRWPIPGLGTGVRVTDKDPPELALENCLQSR